MDFLWVLKTHLFLLCFPSLVFLIFKKFIIFWLCWVFTDVCSLSLDAVHGPLIAVASVLKFHQLWPTGLVAPRHMGPTWTRDRTESPAQAGGFPPGKSPLTNF